VHLTRAAALVALEMGLCPKPC